MEANKCPGYMELGSVRARCARGIGHDGPCRDGALLESWWPATPEDVTGDEPNKEVDPDELGTFGEYLDHYTRRGGMTADERTAFWMSWTRHTIVWVFAGAGALAVVASFGGIVSDGGLLVALYASLVLIWQAVEAVRFGIEGRRWR